MKFEIQSTIDVKLDAKQKEILHDLLELVKTDGDEERMQNGCYEITEKHNISVPDFFKLAYNVIINKEKGPRLATLMVSAREKIIKLLEQI
jgi:lysyl-tRNA synthetase class 1